MRARAAYISSLGTGGIIVASALLMLAMVSALVAFHSWPAGQTTGGSVSSVPLEGSTSVRSLHQTATVTRARPAPSVTRTRPAQARKASSLSTAGLHKDPTALRFGTGPGGGLVKLAPSPGPSATVVEPSPTQPSPGPQIDPQIPGQPQHPGPQDPIQKAIDTIPDVPLPGNRDLGGTATGVVQSLPLPSLPLDDGHVAVPGVPAVDGVTR